MTTQLVKAVDEMLDKGRPDDDESGRESVDNRERGCGHLKPNSAYVRTDVAALSHEDGTIPRFVELDDPVEYREHTGKGAIIPGYVAFPGNSFDKHYVADGRTTTPSDEIEAHHDRLWSYGFDDEHYGKITSAQSVDILMSVGKTNWETPDEYIEECRERGLNLKIPVSDRQEPPAVEPLRTRCWVIHPHGCGEDRPGIIGYSYLTRVVYTTGTKASAEDPDIPAWASDYAAAGKFDVVDRGEPIEAESDAAKNHVPLSEFDLDDVDDVDGFDDDPTDRRGDTEDRDVATVTVADDGAGGDVTGLEVEFGRDDIPWDERRESFVAACDDVLPYNALKVIGSNRDDINVGATPPKDDLIDHIVDDADAVVPAYHDTKPVESGEA
jgi:hypothetical protein